MEDVTLLFDRQLDVGVPLAGSRLVPGMGPEGGLPLEAFLRLYAVDQSGKAVLIAGPADLAPLVTRVGSEEAAWRFLRLFTAPETHYLFQKDAYTIDLRVAAPGEAREVGTITPDDAARFGYQPPQMTFDGGEYTARRDLVHAAPAAQSKPATLVRRREALAEDGAYRLVDERDVGPIARTAVIVPAYE
jgi:hypothetical protein